MGGGVSKHDQMELLNQQLKERDDEIATLKQQLESTSAKPDALSDPDQKQDRISSPTSPKMTPSSNNHVRKQTGTVRSLRQTVNSGGAAVFSKKTATFGSECGGDEIRWVGGLCQS